MKIITNSRWSRLLLAALLPAMPSAAVEEDLSIEYFRSIDHMYVKRPGKGDKSCPVGVTGLEVAGSPENRMVVDRVEPGTPAAGRFKQGDVIVGINDVPLKDLNAFVVFGKMLTRAEATDGRMVFDVQPAGTTTTNKVEVKIPVLGPYSATWPIDCPKSKRIIDQAAAYLSEHLMEFDGEGAVLSRAQAFLFLLSTGDDAYLPRIRQHLAPFIGNPKAIGDHTWNNGYNGILCAEYYLRTGDESIMPVIQYYCDNARDRQYLDGWNHWGREVGPRYMDGGLMNAAGVNVLTSLLLAKECGAEVDEGTLLRALTFYYRLVGKGGVPYGAHRAEGVIGSNGKDGMAAAAMLVASYAQGDASNYKKACDYLAMATITSYPRLGKGHGDGGRGDTWWRGLASSYVRDRDPQAYQRAMDDLRWFYDLSRLPSGKLSQSSIGCWPGTGAMLALTYTAPLKTLRITGAPRSKFARDFTLPARPWGTLDDEAFLDCTNHTDFSAHGSEEPIHVTLARLGYADLKTNPSFAPTKEQAIRDMHHRRYEIRCQAAKVLCKMGALKELESFLSAKDPRLRRAALDGLVDYSYHYPMGKNPLGPSQYTDKMIDSIVGMLRNPDEAWWVVDGALHAMSHMPAEAIQQNIDLVLPWTTHSDWWLRESSFLALSGLKRDKAFYCKVLPRLFDMLQAEENLMSYIYTLKGHFNEQLRSKELDPEVRTLIVDGLNGSAQQKPIRDGWRGAIDGYNTAMLITDLLNEFPEKAPALAQAVLHRVENLPNAQLVRLLSTPNSFNRWTGFHTVLDKLPAKERESLEEILYRGFLPELHKRLAAMDAKGVEVQVLQAAIDLRNLRSPCQWQSVGMPPLAERSWRYMTFDPLRKEDRKPNDIKTHFRRHPIQLPDGMEGWFKPDFDDSTWMQGKTPVGKGTYMAGTHPYKGKTFENASEWGEGEFILMRSAFEISDDYDYYSINVLSTQGYDIYLNGHLVHRYVWYRDRPEYQRIVLNQNQTKLLRKGRNTLAVHNNTEHLQTGQQYGQIDVALEGLRKRDLGLETGQ